MDVDSDATSSTSSTTSTKTLADDSRELLNAQRRATFSANPQKRLREIEKQVKEEKRVKIANQYVQVQFQTMDGDDTGPRLELGTDTTQQQLEEAQQQLEQLLSVDEAEQSGEQAEVPMHRVASLARLAGWSLGPVQARTAR